MDSSNPCNYFHLFGSTCRNCNHRRLFYRPYFTGSQVDDKTPFDNRHFFRHAFHLVHFQLRFSFIALHGLMDTVPLLEKHLSAFTGKTNLTGKILYIP